MDWVGLGSYLMVAVAVIIVVVLGVVGYRLIYRNGDKGSQPGLHEEGAGRSPSWWDTAGTAVSPR